MEQKIGGAPVEHRWSIGGAPVEHRWSTQWSKKVGGAPGGAPGGANGMSVEHPVEQMVCRWSKWMSVEQKSPISPCRLFNQPARSKAL